MFVTQEYIYSFIFRSAVTFVRRVVTNVYIISNIFCETLDNNVVVDIASLARYDSILLRKYKENIKSC